MSKTKAKKIAQKYVRFLEQSKFPVSKAYLFGSYVKRKNRHGSDIDICIISPRMKKNWNKSEALLWRLRREIEPHIEPIGYSPQEFKQGGPLIDEIKKSGIIIK